MPVYSQPRLLIHRRAAGSFSYLQCNRKIQRAQNYQHASYMGYVSKHMVFIFEKVLLLCPHLEIRDSYPRRGSNMPHDLVSHPGWDRDRTLGGVEGLPGAETLTPARRNIWQPGDWKADARTAGESRQGPEWG